MKKLTCLLVSLFAFLLLVNEADAQMGKRSYINIGWQFNAPISNQFVDRAQGYGAYIQSGYYVTPMLAVGTFSSFGTNDEYYPKQTYQLEDGAAVTTDLYRSIFQTPFGVSVRMRASWREFQPYFEAKIGAEYSLQSVYMSTFISRVSNWGFYVSPEIGLSYYPFHKDDVGFHFAAYYSYSTNHHNRFDIHGLNNLGFKLGIAF